MNGHNTPSTSSLSGGANSEADNAESNAEFSLPDAIYGPVPDVDFEYADFSLGSHQSIDRSNRLIDHSLAGRAGMIGLRRNITIIVAGMFIRNHNQKLQVLLVQEAKASCRGECVIDYPI